MKLLFSLSLLLTLSAVLAMVLHFESAALSYFDAWVYFLEFPLGALGILFLAELTGGEWAKQSRRYLRSLKKAFPVLILTFIPLLFFVKDLYPWSVNPDTEEKILFFKAGFYRPLSFTLRSVIYFSLLFFI